MRLHLDTDFAGDPDDACALAMLLGWPGVEIVGITTVADPDGRRAGYVRRLLAVACRDDIPVAAGAATSLDGEAMGDIPDHDRYWGGPPVDTSPLHPSPGAAAALLARSIEAGATVAAIGPLTNLAWLELDHVGAIGGVRVVAMGGWFGPVSTGLPDWGPTHDWNIQCDRHAAAIVASHADLTLVPLSTTLGVQLTRRVLPRLDAAGPLGRLLARQAVAYCEDERKTEIALSHRGLPDDLLNFHHDPLAAAVAVRWESVTSEQMRLRPHWDDAVLSFEQNADGRHTEVVTAVDSTAFDTVWITAVERVADASRRPAHADRTASG